MELFAAKRRNLEYGEQIRYRSYKVILNKNTFEYILTAFVRIYQLMIFEFEKISIEMITFKKHSMDGCLTAS
jgi:hypothetical protein